MNLIICKKVTKRKAAIKSFNFDLKITDTRKLRESIHNLRKNRHFKNCL